MTRIAAVALAVGAVIWVRTIGTATATGSAGTALALGFALVGAWVTGDLLRRFNLPRLTGYLLFGILVGPYLGNVITESMAGQLQVITGIATTLIALIAGLTLNLERLGRRLRGHRADDRRDAGRRHGRPGRARVDRVAVAADRAGGDRARRGWRWSRCWSSSSSASRRR